MTTGRGEGVGHRWDERLHTHHNQVRNPRAPLSAVLTLRLLRKDGFGDSVFICYAILPLYDMNEKTGATSIAAGSHTPENVAYINNYRRENAEALKGECKASPFLLPTPDLATCAKLANFA